LRQCGTGIELNRLVIHSALAYFYDHKEEIVAEIKQQKEGKSQIMAETICENCAAEGKRAPATTHSVNEEYSEYDLCAECAGYYDRVDPYSTRYLAALDAETGIPRAIAVKVYLYSKSRPREAEDAKRYPAISQTEPVFNNPMKAYREAKRRWASNDK